MVPSSHEDPSVSLEQITDLFSQHVKADGSFKGSGRKIRAFFHNAPYGMAGDMDRIAEFLRGRGVLLVEDAAQAFGVRQGGRYLGAFGDFGCWSFNGNKTLAAGAGGALFVADPAQRERALRLRHHGRCDDFEFLYEGLGGNYVMPNTLAALASSQFSRLDQILARKSQIRSFYEVAFSGDLPLLSNRTGRGGEPYWANVVLFPRPLDRDQFHRIVEALGQEGIQVRPCFPPLSRNAPFRSSPLLYPEHSLSLFNRGLMLPSGPGVTKEDVRRVKEALMRAW
ncbi:MAG: DegT/DnrJ/EryC1/StrS family aminotransferase, partial [Bdellovibrionales bacterium]|nr:DegT/DnrJ/EryC1/StrS family aminotransferase [Bdellovibrionales bacterium]